MMHYGFIGPGNLGEHPAASLLREGFAVSVHEKVARLADRLVKGKAAYDGEAQSSQIVRLLEDALETDLRAEGFPARLK